MASGGDGDSRVARGRESGEGERGSREREAVEGVEGVSVASRGSRGGCHGEAGGGVGALGRAPRLASAYWQRKTTSGEVDGLGWAAGGAEPGKSR